MESGELNEALNLKGSSSGMFHVIQGLGSLLINRIYLSNLGCNNTSSPVGLRRLYSDAADPVVKNYDINEKPSYQRLIG